MNSENYGSMRIRAYTASGALPTDGVLVKIYGTDDYNKDIIYSLLTDENGVTRSVSLPAPPRVYSSSPGADECPYSVYNVELVKDGFYPKRIDNVPIFNGVNAVLPIEMIPLTYGNDGAVVPQKNLNSTVYENEHLE